MKINTQDSLNAGTVIVLAWNNIQELIKPLTSVHAFAIINVIFVAFGAVVYYCDFLAKGGTVALPEPPPIDPAAQ